MIDFNNLDNNLDRLSSDFNNAAPFKFVVVDGFCDEAKLLSALDAIRATSTANLNKSRDYIFAKNKFEKSDFHLISPELEELKCQLLSDRFNQILSKITGEEVFVDPSFHGGGLHQGGKGSFLDMHVDFNYHPENSTWFRDLNILLYLNPDWKKEYGGELKLAHGDNEQDIYEIEPLFNRAVIMQTRDFTYHGYDTINFPDGDFRRSIASYAYQLHEAPSEEARTTVWYPKNSGVMKRMLGKYAPSLVKIKSRFLPSGTSKNK